MNLKMIVTLMCPPMGFQHVSKCDVLIMVNRSGAVYLGVLLYAGADIAAKTPLR